MRLIFEKDIEHCDFLEIILSEEELRELEKKGLVNEFEDVLHKRKTLNIFLHLGKDED